MASIRKHIHIPSSPDNVWAVVSDAGTIAEWFPLLESSSYDGSIRHIVLDGGAKLEEEIVTSDDSLRRFQYSIVGGDLDIEFHLGTIDVLDDGDGSLVIYSTDVRPDELSAIIDPALADALVGLRDHLA